MPIPRTSKTPEIVSDMLFNNYYRRRPDVEHRGSDIGLTHGIDDLDLLTGEFIATEPTKPKLREIRQ